jgi:hypothetical protein
MLLSKNSQILFVRLFFINLKNKIEIFLIICNCFICNYMYKILGA